MVASVPELTRRSICTAGTRARTSSTSSISSSVGAPKENPSAATRCTAASTSGWVWPSSIGPHEQTRST